MEELKKLLESFSTITGVRYALISDANGDVVEKSGSDIPEMPMLPLLPLDLSDLSSSLPHPFSQSKLTQSFMEFEGLTLISIPVKNDYFLLLVASPDVNLGRIRLQIKKSIKKLDAILV